MKDAIKKFELGLAMALFDAACREIENVVTKCSMEKLPLRRIGQDGFNSTTWIDPDDKHGIEKAVNFIATTAAGRPVVFSALHQPMQLENVFNVFNKNRTIIGRVMCGYDITEDRERWRIDFLFKVSEPNA